MCLVGAPAARPQTPTALVIDAVEVPLTGTQVARESTDGAVRERHVPLVARPGAGVPPLARHAPRPRASDHARLGPEGPANDGGPALAVRGHAHATRGAQPTQRQHEIGRATRLNSSHSQISYAVFCLK